MWSGEQRTHVASHETLDLLRHLLRGRAKDCQVRIPAGLEAIYSSLTDPNTDMIHTDGGRDACTITVLDHRALGPMPLDIAVAGTA
jgi:hypothetical protein